MRAKDFLREYKKDTDNFTADDLKELEGIKDLATLKARAFQLVSTPSKRPMKPEKVAWFKQAIESKTNPQAIIKLMWDLLLSGEGHAVVGSRSSMDPNSYRRRFNEGVSGDGEVANAVVAEVIKLIGEGHTEVSPDVITTKVSAALGRPFMLKDLVAANNGSPELQHYIDSINPSKIKFSTDILTVKNQDPAKDKAKAQDGVAKMAARASSRPRLGESLEGSNLGQLYNDLASQLKRSSKYPFYSPQAFYAAKHIGIEPPQGDLIQINAAFDANNAGRPMMDMDEMKLFFKKLARGNPLYVTMEPGRPDPKGYVPVYFEIRTMPSGNPTFAVNASEEVAESLRPGQYHTHTVTFDDGTQGKINVPSDEFSEQQIKDFYAKKGKNVVKVDWDYSVQGEPSGGQDDYDYNRQYAPPGIYENAEELNVGDDVIITGPVEFEGETGVIDSFGRDKRFVVVNLYNHGKKSFHSSDVSYNDYADSDAEEAEMYDRDPEFRDWAARQDVAEGKLWRVAYSVEDERYGTPYDDKVFDNPGEAQGHVYNIKRAAELAGQEVPIIGYQWFHPEEVDEGWESGPDERAPRERDPDDWYDQRRQEKMDIEAEKENAKRPQEKVYTLTGRGPNNEPNYKFPGEYKNQADAIAARAKLMADPNTLNPRDIGISTHTRYLDEGNVLEDVRKLAGLK